MKKSVKYGLLALLSLSMVGCSGNTKNPGENPTNNKTEPGNQDNPVTHTLSIEYSGNALTGETITFSASYDKTALTKAEIANVTFSCSDAQAMTFTGNSAVLNKVGTFTVTASYKPSGETTAITATKEVTVTQGTIAITLAELQKIEPSATSSEATDTYTTSTSSSGYTATMKNSYKVKGVVVSLYQYGCILYDGTGYILINDTSKGANKATVGDYYEVVSMPTCYVNLKPSNTTKDVRWWQMTSYNHSEFTLTKLDSLGSEITLPTAKAWTANDQNTYKDKEARGQAVYIKAKASAIKSGSYTNLYVGGTKVDGGEDLSADKRFTITAGNDYEIEGFVFENSDNHIKFYLAQEPVLLAKSVNIVAPSSSIVVGNDMTLTATVGPEGVTTAGVTWTSSDATVATVSTAGVFHSVAVGTVNVTATLAETDVKGDPISSTISITVTAEEVHAASLTLDQTTASLNIGSTVTLTATATASDTTKTVTDPITWTTSDASVATVNNGVVTGVKSGTATITATCGSVTATCTVTVINIYGTDAEPTSPSVILASTLSTTEVYTFVGYITGIDEAYSSTYGNMSFWVGDSASDTADKDHCVKVYRYSCDQSEADQLAVGAKVKVVSTMTLFNGITETAKITSVDILEAAPASITLNHDTYTGYVGHPVKLTATLTNSTETITWTSSDETVATVSNGVVTPVKAGTATITATAGTISATCAFTVASDTLNTGTADAPLSVADFNDIAAKLLSSASNNEWSQSTFYVTGKVTSDPTAKNSSYTFDVEDLTDSSKTMKAYYISYASGVTTVYKNDTVVLCGTICKYKSAYEIGNASGSTVSQVTSVTRGTSSITVSGDENVTVTGIPATAVNGTTVSFNVAAKDGYILDSVKVNGTALEAQDDGSYQMTIKGDMSVVIASHKEGEAASKEYAFDFGTDRGTGVSGYTSTFEVTNSDNMTLSIYGFNNNKYNNNWTYIKCGSKKTAYVATITTKAAVAEAIKTVNFTLDSITTANVNSIKLYVSSDSSFTTKQEVELAEKTAGDKTLTVTTPTANQYYKLEFDCAVGSNNGFVQLSKLSFVS